MAQDDTHDPSQQSPFEDIVIVRGAHFKQLSPPLWSSPDLARCVYGSGAVRLIVYFNGWAKPPQWYAESAGIISGHPASTPDGALANADVAALHKLKRIEDLETLKARIVAAQEALMHPGDAACDCCRAEVTDPAATGVICRACFDAGPGSCVECGAPAHGLVCSPRCADSADLCWDALQKVPA